MPKRWLRRRRSSTRGSTRSGRRRRRRRHPRGGGSQPAAAAAALPPPPPDPLDPKVKTCLAALRRAHALWDKTSREWRGTKAKSTLHANTCGSKFETDLESLVGKGKGLDEKAMEAMDKHNSGTSLTDREITATAKRCTEISDLIKAGNKVQSALNQWMNMPTVEELCDEAPDAD